MRPRIGIIGERQTSEALYEEARTFGRQVAQHGLILVCGGLGGIMEAACRGCSEMAGTAIGILPGDSADAANPYVTVPIVSGMGEGRNIVVVRTSNVVVAIGGSYGTLSEIALALRLSIPVIGIKTWTFRPGAAADSAAVGDAERAIIRVENSTQAFEAVRGLLKTEGHSWGWISERST